MVDTSPEPVKSRREYAKEWSIVDRGIIATTLLMLLLGQVILLKQVGGIEQIKYLYKVVTPLVLFLYLRPYLWAASDMVYNWWNTEVMNVDE